MAKKSRKIVKEQVKDVLVKGLPNPTEFSARINGSGASPDEILGWFGAVMSRLGMAPTETVEDVASVEVEVPGPSPAAMEEKFENNLLDSLLKEINKSTKKRRR